MSFSGKERLGEARKQLLAGSMQLKVVDLTRISRIKEANKNI